MTQKTEATFRYVILEAVAMHMENMDPLPSKLKDGLYAILEQEEARPPGSRWRDPSMVTLDLDALMTRPVRI